MKLLLAVLFLLYTFSLVRSSSDPRPLPRTLTAEVDSELELIEGRDDECFCDCYESSDKVVSDSSRLIGYRDIKRIQILHSKLLEGHKLQLSRTFGGNGQGRRQLEEEEEEDQQQKQEKHFICDCTCDSGDWVGEVLPELFDGSDDEAPSNSGRYGNYANYGTYGPYGNYANYGNYGQYGNYVNYGSSSQYGQYGNLALSDNGQGAATTRKRRLRNLIHIEARDAN
jgi:hypothetical protein